MSLFLLARSLTDNLYCARRCADSADAHDSRRQIGGSIEVAVEIYCNDKENALWKHRTLPCLFCVVPAC